MALSLSKNHEQPYAVIVGLDTMQGLQAARILADRKVPVIAIASTPKSSTRGTKACREILFTDTWSDKLIDVLEALGPTFSQKAVLFPCQDASVLVISRHRQRLVDWYRIMLPEHHTVELLTNKANFYTFAQKEGLPIPKTYLVYSRADAEAAARDITFPCILKPSYKSHEWTKHTKQKAFKVANAEELLASYDHHYRLADGLIVQEWIVGPDSNHYTCNCYFDGHSRPMVTFVSRKLRQWPPLTGQGCLAEECRNDIVLSETIRLFSRVHYCGLGYLEMKCDERLGQYFIVEPNVGRPTGRSAIAEAGGVELLYTMYCDASGWPLPPNRAQKYVGVKWIDSVRDVQSALYYWRRGDLTLTGWWQSVRGRKVYALFSWRDPGHFVRAVRNAIFRWISHYLGGSWRMR